MVRMSYLSIFKAVTFCSAVSLISIGCSDNLVNTLDCSDGAVLAASGNTSESESNNTYQLADVIYDGFENSGKIGYAGDVDYYKITFSKKGKANFYLGKIPSGCDYDLYIYSSNGTSLITSSAKSGSTDELISSYPVEATSYYVVVKGHNNCYNTSTNYLLKVKNYVPLAPNGFTKNWSKYKDSFVKVANSYGIDPYVLAAYSANECNMDPNQFTKYSGSGTYVHPITNVKYTNVKIVNGIVYAAMGLTSVQSQYHSEYKANNYKQLYDVVTNLKIGAAEFSTYKKYSVHDMVGYVHLPSNKNAIDSMKDYAGTGKTYWQVFVDNYNNLKGQDGIFTGLLSY